MKRLITALWHFLPADEPAYRSSILLSVGLHIFIFVSVIIVLPYTKPDLSTPEQFIDVEIISEFEEETRKQDIAKKAKKIEQARAKTPPPTPKAPPPPKSSAPAPEPKQTKAVADDAIILKDKNAPKLTTKKPSNSPKRPPSKPIAKTAPKVAETPPKNPPKKPVKKAKQVNMDSLLKNLENIAASNVSEGKRLENKALQAIEEASQHDDASLKIAEKDTMSLDELQRLKRQIISCWSIPAGARDIQNFIVDVHIYLTPDRRVIKTRILPHPAFSGNPFYRIFVESAERALYDPKCTPLDVPPNKYNLWKEIVFTFNAKDL